MRADAEEPLAALFPVLHFLHGAQAQERLPGLRERGGDQLALGRRHLERGGLERPRRSTVGVGRWECRGGVAKGRARRFAVRLTESDLPEFTATA